MWQKYMIAFCSLSRGLPLILFCVGWKYRLWVDFIKIESVLFLIITSAGQEGK